MTTICPRNVPEMAEFLAFIMEHNSGGLAHYGLLGKKNKPVLDRYPTWLVIKLEVAVGKNLQVLSTFDEDQLQDLVCGEENDANTLMNSLPFEDLLREALDEMFDGEWMSS